MIPFCNHICIVLCSFSFGESCNLSGTPQVEEPQIQRSFWNGTGVLHVLQGPAQLLERIGAVFEPLAPEPVQLYESNKNCVIFNLIDIIALSVAFLDPVGIDTRGIIGAAPEVMSTYF